MLQAHTNLRTELAKVRNPTSEWIEEIAYDKLKTLLSENIKRKVIEVVESNDLYEVRREMWDPDCEMADRPTEMFSAYSKKDGSYCGSADFAKDVLDTYGILAELSSPGHNVASIGWSESNEKWYGWSHRAIYGFKPGDEVSSDDHLCASHGFVESYTPAEGEDRSLPIGFVAQDHADAKRMAIAFADAVS